MSKIIDEKYVLNTVIFKKKKILTENSKSEIIVAIIFKKTKNLIITQVKTVKTILFNRFQNSVFLFEIVLNCT